MKTTSPSSPRNTAWAQVALLAVLPTATGLLVSQRFGWGVDGALFGVMTGGIVFAALLLVVFLQLCRK